MKKLLLIILLTVSGYVSASSIPDSKAIAAIIGEAEGESLQGKIAVAEVIRNRGSLKGIYGVSAPRVLKKLYSAQTLADATRAWELSKTSNLTGGAMGWGNAADIRKFKTQRWFKKCRVVKQIGNHYFWKEI
jgi:spore germination cell wall hydrolase CwlJ-like protein